MPLVSTVRIDGHALRDLRTRRGLTRQQLAGKTGRRNSSIRNLETGGGKRASLVFAYQLANALGLTDENDEPDISRIVIAGEVPDEADAEDEAA